MSSYTLVFKPHGELKIDRQYNNNNNRGYMLHRINLKWYTEVWHLWEYASWHWGRGRFHDITLQTCRSGTST